MLPDILNMRLIFWTCWTFAPPSRRVHSTSASGGTALLMSCCSCWMAVVPVGSFCEDTAANSPSRILTNGCGLWNSGHWSMASNALESQESAWSSM